MRICLEELLWHILNCSCAEDAEVPMSCFVKEGGRKLLSVRAFRSPGKQLLVQKQNLRLAGHHPNFLLWQEERKSSKGVSA